MSQPYDFIYGKAACAYRNQRRRKPGEEHGHLGFVAVVEVAHRRYEEFDAESADHARLLGETWVKHGMAITAAAWRVDGDGRLADRMGDIIAETPEFA